MSTPVDQGQDTLNTIGRRASLGHAEHKDLVTLSPGSVHGLPAQQDTFGATNHDRKSSKLMKISIRSIQKTLK